MRCGLGADQDLGEAKSTNSFSFTLFVLSSFAKITLLAASFGFALILVTSAGFWFNFGNAFATGSHLVENSGWGVCVLVGF